MLRRFGELRERGLRDHIDRRACGRYPTVLSTVWGSGFARGRPGPFCSYGTICLTVPDLPAVGEDDPDFEQRAASQQHAFDGAARRPIRFSGMQGTGKGRHSGSEGRSGKSGVTVGQQRAIVTEVQDTAGYSERSVCRWLGIHRSGVCYRSHGRDDVSPRLRLRSCLRNSTAPHPSPSLPRGPGSPCAPEVRRDLDGSARARRTSGQRAVRLLIHPITRPTPWLRGTALMSRVGPSDRRRPRSSRSSLRAGPIPSRATGAAWAL
jgi:hypothetical protein